MCHVDDVLWISVDAKGLLKEIQKDFKFKKNKIKLPSMYLRARLELKTLNDQSVWTICSKDYVKLAVSNIEGQLQSKHIRPKKALTPMISDHLPELPELDTSPELSSENVTFFQEIIGMLRWAIEIGRVDIHKEVSLLSSYQDAPREDYLEQLLRIVAFLKRKTKVNVILRS